jgi:hypothetical protein
MIRPESVSVVPDRDHATLAARIVSATYLGASTQLRVVTADGLELEVLAGRSAVQSVSLTPGAELGVQVDPAGVWIVGDDNAEAPHQLAATADA